VPEHVHQAADARLAIPMRPGLRSLNVAMAAALAVGEALRQTRSFPDFADRLEEAGLAATLPDGIDP
jgi:tRNA (cytidine/uridine-2'-O-)-methyltransferase